jgi:hypothetical protein
MSAKTVNAANAPLTGDTSVRIPMIGSRGPACILSKEQMDRLLPHVTKMISLHTWSDPTLLPVKEKLKVVMINATQAAFELDDETTPELLEKIQQLCEKKFTKQLTVPQPIAENQVINHQVMEFEVAKKQLLVKFFTLNEANNFDTAINVITNKLGY